MVKEMFDELAWDCFLPTEKGGKGNCVLIGIMGAPESFKQNGEWCCGKCINMPRRIALETCVTVVFIQVFEDMYSSRFSKICLYKIYLRLDT